MHLETYLPLHTSAYSVQFVYALNVKKTVMKRKIMQPNNDHVQLLAPDKAHKVKMLFNHYGVNDTTCVTFIHFVSLLQPTLCTKYLINLPQALCFIHAGDVC